MMHGREAESHIRRVAEAVTQSSLLPRAAHSHELCSVRAAFVAGARTPFVGSSEEVAQGGDGGGDAADAGFDVGAEHGMCDPDCGGDVLAWGLVRVGGNLTLEVCHSLEFVDVGNSDHGDDRCTVLYQ